MKKLFIASLAFIAIIAATSCSDDKEKNEPLPVGDEWIDPTFAQELQERGYIADAKTVTPLDVDDIKEVSVSGKEDNPGNIESLRGIEYFIELTSLNCSYNQLTSLDISKNSQLTYLVCSGNQLKSLGISKNTQLTELNCSDNPGINNKFIVTAWFDQYSVPSPSFQLDPWDYNGHIVTIEYHKYGQQFVDDPSLLIGYKWINPEFAKRLQEWRLIADAETVTPIDVADIEEVNVDYSNLTSLRGIEYFKKLTDLHCDNNQLTSLDISKNSRLKTLLCINNQLTSLDISKNLQLTVLYCDKNQLTSLDVSKNSQLFILSCYDNQLKSLDLSENSKLGRLYCDNNQLTSLDVSKNSQLYTLWCNENRLTTLDVSKNPELTELHCVYNQLTSLDLSKNSQLTTLYCFVNQLTSLDISKNSQLTELHCFYNQLTSLDISKNSRLKRLGCDLNPGINNKFIVTAWFDSSAIPGGFTNESWKYNDQTVTIEYRKAE